MRAALNRSAGEPSTIRPFDHSAARLSPMRLSPMPSIRPLALRGLARGGRSADWSAVWRGQPATILGGPRPFGRRALAQAGRQALAHSAGRLDPCRMALEARPRGGRLADWPAHGAAGWRGSPTAILGDPAGRLRVALAHAAASVSPMRPGRLSPMPSIRPHGSRDLGRGGRFSYRPGGHRAAGWRGLPATILGGLAIRPATSGPYGRTTREAWRVAAVRPIGRAHGAPRPFGRSALDPQSSRPLKTLAHGRSRGGPMSGHLDR
jgi:hypothetical protein